MFEDYKKLLTIAINAFNEEKYIAHTLDSCVNQAGKIIICDSASTDNTQKICEEYAKKYSNIDYHRLDKDYGKDYAFNFPLKKATSKYFMWCGPHDYLDPHYSSTMIHMLENSNAVGCFPAGRSVTIEGEEIGIYDYWYAQDLISDSAVERVYSLIRNLHEISGIYGIFKTELIQKYPMSPGIGGDHPVLCGMAKEGKIIFSPRSIVNWRQTKLHLSPKQIIQSWNDAPMHNKNESGYHFMFNEQMKILKECKARNAIDFIRKLYLIRCARKKLKKRFGV